MKVHIYVLSDNGTFVVAVKLETTRKLFYILLADCLEWKFVFLESLTPCRAWGPFINCLWRRSAVFLSLVLGNWKAYDCCKISWKSLTKFLGWRYNTHARIHTHTHTYKVAPAWWRRPFFPLCSSVSFFMLFFPCFTFSFLFPFSLFVYPSFILHSFFLLSLKISNCILPLCNSLFLFHTSK